MEPADHTRVELAIATATELIGESNWQTRELDKLNATYLWEPIRGGRALPLPTPQSPPMFKRCMSFSSNTLIETFLTPLNNSLAFFTNDSG